MTYNPNADLTDPAGNFIVKGLHGRECPFCESSMHFEGDAAGSGGGCTDCDYYYMDAEPSDSDRYELVTYEDIVEANS